MNYLLFGAGLIVAAGLCLAVLFVFDAVMEARSRGTLIHPVEREDSS